MMITNIEECQTIDTANDVTLDKLHFVLLEMIDEVDRLCRKHRISYFLDSGSALGAIRHGGFIPWDDDADIGMMRKEYNKFIKIAQKELNKKYVLQINDIDPGYQLFHAKIVKLNTFYPQKGIFGYKYQGIMLDIFPFDYIPDEPRKAEKAIKHVRNAERLYYVSQQSLKQRKGIKIMGAFLLKIFPPNFYRMRFERACIKYNKNRTNHVTCYTYWMSKVQQLIFDAEDMTISSDIQFENRKYMIMNNPDHYLKIMYGDYMEFPPESKRQCHLNGEIIFDLKKNENLIEEQKNEKSINSWSV